MTANNIHAKYIEHETHSSTWHSLHDTQLTHSLYTYHICIDQDITFHSRPSAKANRLSGCGATNQALKINPGGLRGTFLFVTCSNKLQFLRREKQSQYRLQHLEHQVLQHYREIQDETNQVQAYTNLSRFLSTVTRAVYDRKHMLLATRCQEVLTPEDPIPPSPRPCRFL